MTILADDVKDMTQREIFLNVNPVNDAPIAYDMYIDVRDQYIVNFTLKGTDVDMDPLSYDVVANPLNGILLGKPPHLYYQSYTEEHVSDQFTFKVSDGVLDSNIATVPLPYKKPYMTTIKLIWKILFWY